MIVTIIDISKPLVCGHKIIYHMHVLAVVSYSATSIIYPDLVYPAPRLSGLSPAQAMYTCACVEGVAVNLQ